MFGIEETSETSGYMFVIAIAIVTTTAAAAAVGRRCAWHEGPM
jgi:hypothetical protein